MKKQILLSIATVLFFAGLSSASAQINLSLNVDKGEKYEYWVEMSMTTTTTANGQKIPIETTMTTTYDMNVLDKTKEVIYIKYTYKDYAMNISTPMMKMSYDSKQTTEATSETEKMLANIFREVINKSFDVKFTPEGKVTSVTGVDEFIRSIEQNNDNAMAKQMSTTLKLQFSNEVMKQRIEQSFNIYSGKPVNVGDTWNIEQSLNVSGAQTGIDTRYTLKSVSNNLAKVDVSSDISVNILFAGTEGAGGTFTGTIAGTIDVNVDTGLPVTSDIIQEIKGNIEGHGINIPMTILTKTKYSVKRTGI
jgi:hypothetical protein